MSDLKSHLKGQLLAKRALRIKVARERQSNPEGGLLEFIRYFWHILEPATPFVEGWVIETLCGHLEAITRKDHVTIRDKRRLFNRFLANVPPGFSKSLTVNCFWPAWEWGPMGLPHLRYVAFSYASELTERDNQKFRDLVCSREYKELWGHVFTVIGDGKVRVTNDKTGFKFASSMGGVGTGERGDRVLCLPAGAMIATADGDMAIEDIVARKSDVKVWSYNHGTNVAELSVIEDYETNPPGDLVEIEVETGERLVCTSDHLVYTTNRGYQKARDLTSDDEVLIG